MTGFNEWLQTYRPMRGGETVQGVQPPAAEQAPAEPAAGESGEQTTTPGVDLGPLLERMDQFGSQLEELRAPAQQPDDPTQQAGFLGYDAYGNPMFDPSTIFQPPPQQQQQDQGQWQQPGQQQVDPALQGLYDQQGQMDPQVAQQLLSVMGQQQQGSQALQGLAAQVNAMRLELDAGALEAQYPELADETRGREVVETAQQYAARMGNPALAQNPGFIEVVYLAEKAKAHSQQETPAGENQGAELESAQGAGAPTQDGPDLAQQIVDAGGGSGFWGFTPKS